MLDSTKRDKIIIQYPTNSYSDFANKRKMLCLLGPSLRWKKRVKILNKQTEKKEKRRKKKKEKKEKKSRTIDLKCFCWKLWTYTKERRKTLFVCQQTPQNQNLLFSNFGTNFLLGPHLIFDLCLIIRSNELSWWERKER